MTCKCSAINKENKPCSLSVSKNGLCHIHFKASKETMFKKELKKMHERVRYYNTKLSEYHRKLELINKLDYIKMRLIEMAGPKRAFKDIVSDKSFQFELEDLFDLPFQRINEEFNKMLDERNLICHKYRLKTWDENKRPNQALK